MSDVANRADEDIEFIPGDEILEAEPAGAEDEAMHVQEREEPRGLMVVESEDFEAERLDEAKAEDVELEPHEASAEAEEEAEGEEEHGEDLEEILRHHCGIVTEEPEEQLETEDVARRKPGAGEFVCRSCFLRKPAFQLSDPARGICVDYMTNGV